MKHLLTLWLSVATFIGVAQDAPYTLNTGREIGLMGAGLATNGIAYVLTNRLEPLTPTDVTRLNRAGVNAFDRSATFRWSPIAADISQLTIGSNVALAGGVAVLPNRARAGLVAPVMFVETMLLANGLKEVVKSLDARTRPFVYNPDAPLAPKLEIDARRSFYSGHATVAFASAVFTSEVFRHYFPESRLKPVVWVGTLGLATATAYLRYDAGKHYPSDLLVGAAVGSAVGWLVPKLHETKPGRVRRNNVASRHWHVTPWNAGGVTGLTVRWMVASR